MNDRKTGHCLCGATSFEYTGRENWTGHCHCESCRRGTSSAFTTFVGVPNGAWRWTGAAPKTFASSKGVIRSFCNNCGSPMAYQTTALPDEIHFYAASLVDQTHLKPQKHFFTEEAVDWVHLGDDLPAHKAFQK